MAQPPGLEGHLNLTKFAFGGDENWCRLAPLKVFTNAFIVDEKLGKILLGLKKRGFATGIYNGFGGKLEKGETPLEAAARELEEEACITADLKPCGILLFGNEALEFSYYIHVFRATSYHGTPTETDEMRPEWFAIPRGDVEVPDATEEQPQPRLREIPYEQMWQDDIYWLPMLLEGRKFVGRADFHVEIKSDDGKEHWVMDRWWFGEPKTSL